ncbi:MAG: proline hydroxylase, partial [Gammaproteobacteria bacterium]
YKAILTKWFRSEDESFHADTSLQELPRMLTRNGFMKAEVPSGLMSALREFHQSDSREYEDEHVPDFIPKSADDAVTTRMLELPHALRELLHAELQPLVEAWAGDYLVPTYVYGIREYLRGSILKMHRDRVETHIASVILNVDQQGVRTPWSLFMHDHQFRTHAVLLEPGEMLFYEGARLLHGRSEPFDGERYANVFVHYKCL